MSLFTNNINTIHLGHCLLAHIYILYSDTNIYLSIYLYLCRYASTLEHTLIFLKCIITPHVFMNLVLRSKKLIYHIFCDLAK